MKKEKDPIGAILIEIMGKGKDKGDKEEDPEVEIMRAFEDAKSAEEKASLLKDFIALCLMRKEEAEENPDSEEESEY